ncbi:MAG: TetR family transcriptional regulator [Clostridia bacterium]|nr:TetR family transcriptional regulator [Clostridia bacterium]
MFIYYRIMRTKDERKYQAVIDASIRTFKEDGFAKASIGKIAKTANVSPATIYIYFENKEDLITQLYLHLRREMSEIVLGDVQLNGCIETAYKKMWMNYYHYCLNHHDKFDYIMQYTNSPFAKANSSKYDAIYFSQIYELFRIGKAQGLIKQVSDEILFAYTFYPASQLAKRNMCCGSKLCDLGVENACLVAWDAVRDRGAGVECKKLEEDIVLRMRELFKKSERDSKFIGVEFEHFLIDVETLRSYEYEEPYGQKSIAEKLVQLGWKVSYEEKGNILALEKDGNGISFEPGGQFEISLKPLETVSAVDETYQSVLKGIYPLLQSNQALVSLGYHPKTKIDALPLLPKERYDFMYNYLYKYGSMARNMMKGTASTQVSIDYDSEEDFTKKYRVANFLAPFISRLFDAAPIFEGQLYDANNLRIMIWEHTDITRCKIPRDVMNKKFDYTSYAKYIANTKPILMPSGEHTRFTDELTVQDLSKSYYLSDSDLKHAMTMVFPDVRLKQFIEIRMADALPYPHNMAVPALIKGLFYNKPLLDYYYEISLAYNDADIIHLNNQMKKNYDYEFLCMDKVVTCHDFVDELLKKVIDGLDDDRKYLEDFRNWVNINTSYTTYLKSLYGTPEFVKRIKGDLCLS